jgi:hypothetical protein
MRYFSIKEYSDYKQLNYKEFLLILKHGNYVPIYHNRTTKIFSEADLDKAYEEYKILFKKRKI